LEGRAGPAALAARTERARQRLDALTARLLAAPARTVRGARADLEAAEARFDRRLERGVAVQAREVARIAGRLRPQLLPVRLDRDRARLTEALRRLSMAAGSGQAARRTRLEALDRLRESLGFERTLERGFAVIRDGAGVVTSGAAARAAGRVEIVFAGGDAVDAVVGPGRKARSKRAPPEQDELF
jgi:exodeoxyribonuclease VII large subunit